MTNKAPIALYIHWPFCVSKCPYCDFNSHVRAQVDMAAWQAALLSDMAFEAELNGNRPLSSIFFGGGTPSLMPPEIVATLIEQADKYWQFTNDIEITLEANPNSVEVDNFAALAGAGVNRVSLGIQSLRTDTLKFLGRAHNVNEAKRAIDTAQRHFARVSIDLIYALPDQKSDDWAIELKEALAFGTDHMSLYQLTIEPGTRFASDFRRGILTPTPDDNAAVLYHQTLDQMAAANMPVYEISNFAKAGQESRHNLTYWTYGDYIGIGPGAHGRRPNIIQNKSVHMATQRHKKPENFTSAIARNGHGMEQENIIPPTDQGIEALLMGLRLYRGMDIGALSARLNRSVDQLVNRHEINKLTAQGFASFTDNHLTITAKGMPMLDHILGNIVEIDE
ncbi:coproporphyrinogen III oxidase [Sphingorhabdus lutea]|uniref:Heme chaperone HemW n=1 Tax=Sphingorhabdus lutea TaxID=1913578 RepID=A0A1L3JBF2_9SPHN|nr:radical SAM family heme chaperone HemW [Sphingorhabdus lutea]APG62465.1 coproporphyrinogen III oxidase [Sphingorhabdus lutea]